MRECQDLGTSPVVHVPNTLLFAPCRLANEKKTLYPVWVDELGHGPASFGLMQPLTGTGLGGGVSLRWTQAAFRPPPAPPLGISARSVTRTAMFHVDAETERPGLEAKGRHLSSGFMP